MGRRIRVSDGGSKTIESGSLFGISSLVFCVLCLQWRLELSYIFSHALLHLRHFPGGRSAHFWNHRENKFTPSIETDGPRQIDGSLCTERIALFGLSRRIKWTWRSASPHSLQTPLSHALLEKVDSYKTCVSKLQRADRVESYWLFA